MSSLRPAFSPRSARRGQAILELVFFVSFFAGFMVMAYLMFSVFNISQKQTMMLRTQAFMELGNHSDFSQSRHGEDDTKSGKGRVDFALGTKSIKTNVDLEKQEAFKKATEGELEIDITRAVKDDDFWNRYQIPKGKTKLVFIENQNSQPLLDLDLEQTLSIVHNRSINVNAPALASTKSETGAYSGSLTFEVFTQVLSAAQKAAGTTGLRDNLDAIREISRQLVKNDPSLSKEAEELEKSVNVAEGITGGLQAAVIATAIQIAMVEGMSALQGLSEVDEAGKSGGDAASAGNSASSGGGPFDRMTGGIFQKPDAMAQMAAKGSFGESLVNTVVSPIRDVGQGFAGFTTGVSGLAEGGNTWGNLTGAMSGLSRVGQSASFGASVAGTRIEGLDLATAALGAPGAITSGVKGFETSWHDPTTNGGHDWTGMIRSTTQILTPLTQIVSLTATDLAAPMSYINMGLGMAGAISSGVDMVGKWGKEEMTLPKTLQEIGMFTASAGALYSGVAALTGNDPTMGAYISLGGSALAGLGGAIDYVKDLKKEDLRVGNPIKALGSTIKDNVTGAGDALKKFGQDMTEVGKTIRTDTNQIFAAKVKIEDPNAKGFLGNVRDVDKMTSGMVQHQMSGVSSRVTGGNIDVAVKKIDEMQGAMLLNMKYHGASEAELAEARFKFAEVQKTAKHLQEFKNNPAGEKNPNGIAYDSKLVAAGKEASDELNRMMAKHVLKMSDLKKPEIMAQFPDVSADDIKPYAQRQLKAIRAGSAQAVLEQKAVAVGQTYKDQKELERILLDQKGLSGAWFAVQGMNGGSRTLKAFDNQQRQALELATAARAEQIILSEKARAQRIRDVVQASEKISLAGPIASNHPILLRQEALKLSSELRQSLEDPAYRESISGTMQERIKAQASKLELIGLGQQEILSEREFFDYAKRDIDRGAAELKQRKLAWEARQKTVCAGASC